MILLDSLLLERNALVLESLLSLHVDLSLGQLVHGAIILLLKLVNLGMEGCLFSLLFSPELLDLLLFSLNLAVVDIFLVL